MPLPMTGRQHIPTTDFVTHTLENRIPDVNKPILIDPSNPSQNFSRAAATSLIRKLIAGLRASGLKKGDTVLLHSFNSIYYPILVLSIVGAGFVFVGTNPSYTQTELNHALKIAKVKLVLAEPEILSNVQKAVNSSGGAAKLIVLDTRPEQSCPQSLPSWKGLLEHGQQDWIRFDDLNTQYNTTACLFYTSGTTGLPKCAMTSHRNLVAQDVLWSAFCKMEGPRRSVQTFPIFHIGSFVGAVCTQLREGRELYIPKRFDLANYLELNSKLKLNEVTLAPPMATAIVMSGLADPKSPNFKYDLSSVKQGFVGAAPLSQDLQKRFHALLGKGARFTQVWGMTESTSMITGVPTSIGNSDAAGSTHTWGNVGTSIPELEVKLVDENGKDVTMTKRRGEALARGPTIVRGYFENPKATEESFDKEGWYRTGDVLELDMSTGVGLFTVVERMKELIKVRAFQVAPAELEGVLTSHPDIIDAGVIGIPDDENGELPRAYVVLRPGSKLDEKMIQNFTADKVAKYKALKGGVIIVESIPKLPSGKILKRVLREWAKDGDKNTPRAKL